MHAPASLDLAPRNNQLADAIRENTRSVTHAYRYRLRCSLAVTVTAAYLGYVVSCERITHYTRYELPAWRQLWVNHN